MGYDQMPRGVSTLFGLDTPVAKIPDPYCKGFEETLEGNERVAIFFG